MSSNFTKVKTVACIGEAMLELRLDSGNAASVSCAGDTLNTAIYLKRAWPDGKVSFVSAFGVEAVSDRIMAFIQAEDIDTSHVVRLQSHNAGLYAISLDKSGERSFTYWRETSAARQMVSHNCGLNFAALAEFDMIYLSAISLAILPDNDREWLIDFLTAYRTTGGVIAFDSNYRPALWANQTVARKAIMQMWKITDMALPSLDDEMALFGDNDEDAVLSRLAGWGANFGALKRGPDGPRSLACNNMDVHFEPAQSVKDTTAAGDSFNAAYIATLILGKPEQDCLLAGHTLARHVIGHSGAIVPAGAKNE